MPGQAVIPRYGQLADQWNSARTGMTPAQIALAAGPGGISPTDPRFVAAGNGGAGGGGGGGTGTGGGAQFSGGSGTYNYDPRFGGNIGAIPTVSGPNLGQVYPNLSGTNAALSSALVSELTGQLSPHTLNNIQNAAAAYGITSGMPGSGLAMFKYPRDVGIASEDLINKGIGNYSSAIPSVSSTQTVNPTTQAQLNTEINATNAQNAAAPNPGASASYAQQLFDKYLSSLSSPAGGTTPAVDAGKQWWQRGANATAFGYNDKLNSFVNHGMSGF